jgi:hypothetical protein
MKTSNDLLREGWLRDAVELIERDLIKSAGYALPKAGVQVSVGFPRGRTGKGQHSIGQCWSHKCSAGDVHEIFISPEIGKPARVLDVLIHELAHVIAGVEAGHKKEFCKVALALGLEGKMTATKAGEKLTTQITGWLKKLPKYPHHQLNVTDSVGTGPKKQGTRLIKAECDACGYAIRVTQKWLFGAGNPTCPCGGEIKPDDSVGGDDGE